VNPADRARAVADAVLYEGFLLYPYTGSALKNRLRWQFGVLMPQGFADTSEPTSMETQLLAQPRERGAVLEIVFRFLQVLEKPVEREVALAVELCDDHVLHPFAVENLRGTMSVDIVRDGPYSRIILRVQNEGIVKPEIGRDEALRLALVSSHALFTISGGSFISLLDPADEAKEAASRCTNRRVFPVLAGAADEGGRTAAMALASPIILYDFPSVAQKSPGHTFDNLEIDELLLLSVASLTDEEKAEARATDERARAIIDRADAMGSALQENLHAGMQVRVHPKRSADAFDMFAEGKTATVRGLHQDVDGRKYVSVVFDDDPATDMHDWYGRSFFYETDEVEPA
jgi:hypothetical protein